MRWIVLPNMMPCGRVILPTLGRLKAESSKDVNLCRGLQIQEVFKEEPKGLQGGKGSLQRRQRVFKEEKEVVSRNKI